MQKKFYLLLFLNFFLVSIVLSAQPRETYSINSAWKFKKGNIDLQVQDFNQPDWEIINIPHTWNDKDVTDEKRGYYRGIGWYKKNIMLDSSLKNKRLYIYFEGANQEAEVFFNGNPVGNHKGGYTAFSFDITDYANFKKGKAKTRNEVAVKLDNSHNIMIPPLSADFTFYGGIYRDVYLVATSPVHFEMTNHASDGIFVETPDVSKSSASVRVWGSIKNHYSEKKNLELSITIKDQMNENVVVETKNLNIKEKDKISFDIDKIQIASPKLWSPENPYLYTIEATITDRKNNQVYDRKTIPLGCRWYRFDTEKGFMLNGEPYKLIGANRHQDYPGLGNALPDYLHEKDMKLLKEMGANFIRIAHYPQDKSLIRACDRLGLLASIEIPFVNYLTEDEAFYNNCKNMSLDMIRQYRNHPSIIIWCYMNETLLKRPFNSGKDMDQLSDREEEYFDNINQLSKDLHELSKEEDPLRPTMFVFHGKFDVYDKAGIIEIPDIVGWNLYYGWYGTHLHTLKDFLERYHDHYPDKPMIIAEYGTGADPRIRTTNPERFDFSVEYQTLYHEYYWETIKKHPFIVGGAIWNFIDFNSEGRKDAVPHINSKGILSLDRKPKDTYYYYQSQLLETPVTQLAPTFYSKRSGLEDQAGRGESTQLVWIYSNQEEVELIHNNQSLGKKKVDSSTIVYEVPFIHGTNQLHAIGYSEEQEKHDFQEIDFIVQSADIKQNGLPYEGININIGSHYHFTDNYGRIWLPEKPYKKGTYGYTGGNKFMRWGGAVPGSGRNILGTKNDPVYQTQRDSIKQFNIDVSAGEYEVTLHFAELMSDKAMKKLVYNLGADEETDQAIKRVFDIKINNEMVLSNLNIANDFGELRAVRKTFIISVKNEGIKIDFNAHHAGAVLNGIQIKKQY